MSPVTISLCYLKEYQQRFDYVSMSKVHAYVSEQVYVMTNVIPLIAVFFSCQQWQWFLITKCLVNIHSHVYKFSAYMCLIVYQSSITWFLQMYNSYICRCSIRNQNLSMICRYLVKDTEMPLKLSHQFLTNILTFHIESYL